MEFDDPKLQAEETRRETVNEGISTTVLDVLGFTRIGKALAGAQALIAANEAQNQLKTEGMSEEERFQHQREAASQRTQAAWNVVGMLPVVGDLMGGAQLMWDAPNAARRLGGASAEDAPMLGDLIGKQGADFLVGRDEVADDPIRKYHGRDDPAARRYPSEGKAPVTLPEIVVKGEPEPPETIDVGETTIPSDETDDNFIDVGETEIRSDE